MSRSELRDIACNAIAAIVVAVAICLFGYWIQATREERMASYLLDEIQRRGMAPQAVPK